MTPRRRARLAPRLILASASPRRSALLRARGYRFRTVPARIPERRRSGEGPAAMARRLAAAKALAVAARLRAADSVVLGADTIVTIDGLVLGKPRDKKQAARILRLLSGRAHRVITGVALCTASLQTRSASATTWVRFRSITREEIDAYTATGEPMDKAGAYAIQGGAAAFVTRIRGSRTNVIGLPMELVEKLLHSFQATK